MSYGRYQQKRAKMEARIHELETKIEEEKDSFQSQLQEFESKVSDLGREVAKQTFEVARLSTQLLEYQDYEEIKKELEIFKGLEGDYDDTSKMSLEQLLMDKNKKLENENTSLKVFLCILMY